ncbi:MAG: cadherin repeat domain-containing protein, partial [Planctomycetota bacterium]
MTQRERILAILVGSLAVIGVGQWGFTKYKTALETRKSRYESLQQQTLDLKNKQERGALADRQMGEYLVRSLGSDIEQARSDYQAWLLEIVTKKHNLEGAKVGRPRTIPVGDLYQQFTFELTGSGDMSEIIAVVHELQSKDYLHRIRELDIKPNQRNELFELTALIDAVSINSAAEKTASREENSWRVEPDLVAYAEPILNRNLFEPPNKAPAFSGDRTLEATVGRDEAFTLVFKDSEGHRISYDLVEGPDNVRLDRRSGTLRVRSDEITEFEVKVSASDNGRPMRSTEQTLLVKVVDPPPPPPEKAPPLKYDDAKQTYLTGLVQGSKDWTAWMNVRTRGKTLKLRVGDEFEV